MSGFWDKMTQEKPINSKFDRKVDAPSDESELYQLRKKVEDYEVKIMLLEQQVERLKQYEPVFKRDGDGMADIEASVMNYTKVTDIKSRSRKHDFVRSKILFSLICRANGYRVTAIADYLGIDHSTVIHYTKHHHKSLLPNDYQFLQL